VVRIAMRYRVGIGKLAIYGREYLVAVRPTSQAVLMLHTLHHAAEIRGIETIDDLQQPASAPVSQVKLAHQVIAALMGPLDLGDFSDDYQADLRRIIDAKIAGEDIVEPTPIATPAVVNLREALEQSLQAVGATTKRLAKATPALKRKRAS